MDYTQAQSFLHTQWKNSTKPRVDKMQALLESLAMPRLSYPVIHVAGTNGKGSVCAMLDSIFRSAGYKTGLFTSPHLVSLTERIQVAGHPISEEHFLDYFHKIKLVAEIIGEKSPDDYPFFFEWMSAIGFLYFADQSIDVAIVEVGLGGIYDSTNVVDPELSIITSISEDHEEILGFGIENIVKSKAGIIKPKKPVLIGPLPEAAESIVREKALEMESALFSVKELFGSNLDDYPKVPLAGDYQRINAAIATAACGLLESKFPKLIDSIEQGLQQVKWPGRWQELPLASGARLFLDVSHNKAGAEILSKHLIELRRETTGRLVAILTSTGDKRAQVIVPALASHVDEIILVQTNHPNASPFEVLEAAIPSEFTGRLSRAKVEDFFIKNNLSSSLNIAPNDALVVAGSISLAGEFIKRLELLK